MWSQWCDKTSTPSRLEYRAMSSGLETRRPGRKLTIRADRRHPTSWSHRQFPRTLRVPARCARMADELDDIEPDLLRERLRMLAEHGEITGKQAEATAAAYGLEPFARKPELPRFDPTLKSHWSITMVVAWIVWRDFELVRKQDPEFCSACFHWVGRARK